MILNEKMVSIFLVLVSTLTFTFFLLLLVSENFIEDLFFVSHQYRYYCLESGKYPRYPPLPRRPNGRLPPLHGRSPASSIY